MGNHPKANAKNGLTARSAVSLLSKILGMKSKTIHRPLSITEWMGAESRTFTALCGESFTRWEVLKAAAGTISLIAASILAGGIA